MRNSRLWCALFLVGCGTSGAHSDQNAPHSESHAAHECEHGEGRSCEHHHEEGDRFAPTRVTEAGARVFGSEPDPNRTLVSLADLTREPSRYAGQVVHTRGTVERVCQRMGCWIELKDSDSPAVRVPMAGHAFFLPPDVQGRAAEVEGEVRVEELSAEQRAHLESEGAAATSSTLSIEARSVVVSGAAH